MFLSRIFINKVLPITKAVANYDDYPLKFYKAKSKLYRISVAPKRNSMLIRIIPAIDSWICIQIWFYHVLLKWYCNSLLLLSRLTNVTKKNAKHVALSLKLNQSPRLSKSELTMLGYYGGLSDWATEYENAVSCLDWKHNGKLNQITCTFPLFEKYFTTHFMTACYRILIDLFSK